MTKTKRLSAVPNDDFCACGYRESEHTDGAHPLIELYPTDGSTGRTLHPVNHGKFQRSVAFNEAERMHEKFRHQLELDVA